MTDLYDDLLGAPEDEGRFYGVAIGVVTNLKDPKAWGRVKLKLPWLAEDVETDWARVAMPMAGPGFGTWFMPEVNTEVLVAFEHGSLEHPYVIGSLWNGKASSPPHDRSGKNDVRSITSRSGHRIRLVDTKGEESIEIVDRSGKNSIVVDTVQNSVTISAEGDIAIRSTKGKVTLHGKAGVEVGTDAALTLQGKAKAELTSSGQLVVKGAIVNIN